MRVVRVWCGSAAAFCIPGQPFRLLMGSRRGRTEARPTHREPQHRPTSTTPCSPCANLGENSIRLCPVDPRERSGQPERPPPAHTRAQPRRAEGPQAQHPRDSRSPRDSNKKTVDFSLSRHTR
eukprot:4510848-Prymnesium_polylepis.1